MKNEPRFSSRHLSMAVVMAGSLFLAAPVVMASDDGHDSHDSHQWGERATGLTKEVRDATRRFQDVSVAIAEGYGPFLGCVSGPEEGAMGIHYVNNDLVMDGLLDAGRPEILVYEPRNNGRLRLVAVEFLVIADAWHAGNTLPPALSGQVFHYAGSPNRYGLPPFYELHTWAWKDNPHGMFVDWNPRVSCEQHAPDPT